MAPPPIPGGGGRKGGRGGRGGRGGKVGGGGGGYKGRMGKQFMKSKDGGDKPKKGKPGFGMLGVLGLFGAMLGLVSWAGQRQNLSLTVSTSHTRTHARGALLLQAHRLTMKKDLHKTHTTRGDDE